MGIDRNINMPKRFGLDSKPISLKFLGPLGRGRWYRIQIRHDERAGQSIVPEIYAFMPAREASSLAIREGAKVLVSVKPCAPPGKDPVWIINRDERKIAERIFGSVRGTGGDLGADETATTRWAGSKSTGAMVSSSCSTRLAG